MIRKWIQDSFRKVGVDIRLIRPDNYTWLQSRNIAAVLDIGANTGQYAIHIAKLLPKARIYSFEPISSCYQDLQKNTAGLNVKAFPFALGETEETMPINVSGLTPSSSLLPMANLHETVFSGSEYQSTETIQVRRLDDIASQLDLSGKYLVKIDVQGFEDRVIRGGKSVIAGADLVWIETTFQELYQGQVLFGAIYDMLTELGFEFRGNISQAKNPADGSYLYADSLFFRKDS